MDRSRQSYMGRPDLPTVEYTSTPVAESLVLRSKTGSQVGKFHGFQERICHDCGPFPAHTGSSRPQMYISAYQSRIVVPALFCYGLLLR
jgi:hypothetical protein